MYANRVTLSRLITDNFIDFVAHVVYAYGMSKTRRKARTGIAHPANSAPEQLNRAEIRRRREEMGLSLAEAAQAAGFHGRQTWYRIEAGGRTSVSPWTLLSMARTLHCSMEHLVIEPNRHGTPRTAKKADAVEKADG